MFTVFFGSCFSLLSKMHVSLSRKLIFTESCSSSLPCETFQQSFLHFLYPGFPYKKVPETLTAPVLPGTSQNSFLSRLPLLWTFHKSLTCCPPGFSNLFAVPSPAPLLSQDPASPICQKGLHLATLPPQAAHHLLPGTPDSCPTSFSETVHRPCHSPLT